MSESFQPSDRLRDRLDKGGIFLSALCLIHCVASVVIISGLGVGGTFLLAEEIHRTGLIIATLIAGLAIGWGVYLHRRIAPALVAGSGLMLMGAAIFSPHGVQEAVLTICGVVLVSIGHVMNMRQSRRSSVFVGD